MNLPSDSHEKMLSAYRLLGQDMLSVGAFENIRVLIRGIHPDLDEKLEKASKALSIVGKLATGDIISLSAEHLPEGSEKEKKRKKAILFFISSIKDLRNEMKRVDTELSSGNNSQMSVGRIIKYAKGPFGLITLAAVLIIGFTMLTHKNSTQMSVNKRSAPTGKLVQVITYNGKQIPLTQLRIANAHYPGCDGIHYHALNIQTETVTALDGTTLYDPGGCGFGKVIDMQVTTISQ